MVTTTVIGLMLCKIVLLLILVMLGITAYGLAIAYFMTEYRKNKQRKNHNN